MKSALGDMISGNSSCARRGGIPLIPVPEGYEGKRFLLPHFDEADYLGGFLSTFR